MSRPVIEVTGLTKKFGAFTAVDHISFTVNQGEILGFLGPNGAGKTTAIKMINGLLKITAGQIKIRGVDAIASRQQIKQFTGYMAQKFSLYPLLKVQENVKFFAGISGLSRKETRAELKKLERLLPERVMDRQVSDLPPGILQQVSLSVSLLTDPEVLFLDEPTSGVDPETRRHFWEKIYELKTRNKTVLITTHNLDEAEYADRVLILHHGRVIMQGRPEQLKQEYKTGSMEELFKQAVQQNEEI